jgi:hypothetical protein
MMLEVRGGWLMVGGWLMAGDEGGSEGWGGKGGGKGGSVIVTVRI